MGSELSFTARWSGGGFSSELHRMVRAASCCAPGSRSLLFAGGRFWFPGMLFEPLHVLHNNSRDSDIGMARAWHDVGWAARGVARLNRDVARLNPCPRPLFGSLWSSYLPTCLPTPYLGRRCVLHLGQTIHFRFAAASC